MAQSKGQMNGKRFLALKLAPDVCADIISTALKRICMTRQLDGSQRYTEAMARTMAAEIISKMASAAMQASHASQPVNERTPALDGVILVLVEEVMRCAAEVDVIWAPERIHSSKAQRSRQSKIKKRQTRKIPASLAGARQTRSGRKKNRELEKTVKQVGKEVPKMNRQTRFTTTVRQSSDGSNSNMPGHTFRSNWSDQRKRT